MTTDKEYAEYTPVELESSLSHELLTVGNSEKAIWIVSLRSLRAFLVRDFEKARVYKTLPVFLLWLTGLTTLIIISGVANPTTYNVLYHLEHAHHLALEIEKFEDLESVEGFWDWADAVVAHLWEPGPLQQNFPLGYLLLRQYRVSERPYETPKVISPNFAEMLPPTILPDWASGLPSREPYGPGKKWVPNSQRVNPISVLSVNTAFNTFDNPGDAFAVPLNFYSNHSTVNGELQELRENGWIDKATRIVIVDVLTYNPSANSFAANHMSIEFFASGSTAASSKAYPFRVYDLDSHSMRSIFALDCAAVLGTLVVLLGLFQTIWINRQLGQQWVNVWEIFEVILVAFVVVCYSYRMWLWTRGPSLMHGDHITSSQNPDLEMFTALFDYGYRFERGSTFMALSVTMAWLRVLRVLQHNDRLGVLSLTIKFAAGELFSLAWIFSVVLIGYSIGCTALYGADFVHMNSISASIGYLCRLLVSAEIGSDWEELYRIHPEFTWPFMGSFVVLSWLILLNMVLAIVSGSFASVQAACGGKVASWSIASLVTDILKLKRRLFGRNCCSKGSSSQDKRRQAIQRLNAAAKKHPDGIKCDVSLREFQTLVHGIYSPAEARMMYEKADKDPRMRVMPEKDEGTKTAESSVGEFRRRDSHIFGEFDESALYDVKEQLDMITKLISSKNVQPVSMPCKTCGLSSTELPYCPRTGERHVGHLSQFQPPPPPRSGPPAVTPQTSASGKLHEPDSPVGSMSRNHSAYPPVAEGQNLSMHSLPDLAPSGGGWERQREPQDSKDGQPTPAKNSWHMNFAGRRPTVHVTSGRGRRNNSVGGVNWPETSKPVKKSRSPVDYSQEDTSVEMESLESPSGSPGTAYSFVKA